MAQPQTYRPSVGIVLINPSGKVFIARRIGLAENARAQGWQMPQGGIDRGETTRVAVMRELREEIGTDAVTILAERARWRSYDVPGGLVKDGSATPYRGQRQKWVLALFSAPDSAICLATRHPEFDAWRWAEPHEAEAHTAPFKQAVYRDVLAEFAPLIAAALTQARTASTPKAQAQPGAIDDAGPLP